MSSRREPPAALVVRDDEATLRRAKDEARDLLARGNRRVGIVQSRLKLPSGIVGYRYFAMSEWALKLFGEPLGLMGVYTSPIELQ